MRGSDFYDRQRIAGGDWLRRLKFNALLVFCLGLLDSAAAQTAAPITNPSAVQSASGPTQRPLAIAPLFGTRIFWFSTWSPDGRTIAFVSNISGRRNIWLLDRDGGWPSQLTTSEDRQRELAWSPDGKWIAFTSDHNGDERFDIYAVSPATGEVMNLTNTPDLAEEAPVWSPDGQTIAYVAKPGLEAGYEVFLLDLESKQSRRLTKGTPKELNNAPPIWSADGKRLSFARQRSDFQNSDIYVATLDGAAENLTPHEGDKTFTPIAWSPNGKYLLLSSDAENGYTNVALLEVATKKLSFVTHDQAEAKGRGFSRDGGTIFFTRNVEGNSDLFTCDLAGKRMQRLPLPRGVNGIWPTDKSLNRDGRSLLVSHEGADSPNDLFVHDLATSKSRRITNSLIGGLKPDNMVAPELVHFPSSDGKWTVPAWLYVPRNLMRNRSAPLVVYAKGGPAWQMPNGFQPVVQALVSRGFVVIAPNYRGTSGYGTAYQKANLRDVGGGDFEDLRAAADFALATGFVDPERRAILGVSYGGYLTMVAVTRAPELFRTAVAVVPFVNWFTEMANEDPAMRESDRSMVGDPVKDAAFLRERSPYFFADRIKSAVLLIAAGKDPRCPPSESEQMAAAIRMNGGNVELKIYSDEGHGLNRIENQIDAYERAVAFLAAHDKNVVARAPEH